MDSIYSDSKSNAEFKKDRKKFPKDAFYLMNGVFIAFLWQIGKKNPIKNRFNGIKKFRKYNKKVQQ